MYAYLSRNILKNYSFVKTSPKKSDGHSVVADNKLTRWELLWYGIIFWSIVLTALETTFSFAFRTNLQMWQVWSDIIIGAIFAADLIADLKKHKKTGHSGPLKGKRGVFWFFIVINAVACVPFNAIAFTFSIEKGAAILHMARLLRLVKILKIFALTGDATLMPRPIKISVYTVISFIIIHWMACGWRLIYPPEQVSHIMDYYVKCLYWAVTTLTTIGYGDVVPTSTGGRIFTMFVMIVGVALYGLIIGNFAQVFAENARIKEQAKEKLRELHLFMHHYSIPIRLQNAAFDYYKHLMTKQLTDSDQKIISELPLALQQELKNYMNIKLIATLPLFKGCSTACLRDTAAALTHEFYAPAKTVFQVGQTGHEMYIIGHGIVEVIAKDGNVVAVLREGQFFGESALLQKTTRNASVRAKTYCDLYKLDTDNFLAIIKKHPKLLANIEKASTDRHAAPANL